MKQSEDHVLIWNNHIDKLKDIFSDYIPKIYEDSDYQAIIIETRNHSNLETVIKNVMYFLNETNSNIKWSLRMFHGNNNQKFIKELTKKWRGVRLTNLYCNNFTINDYNDLMLSKNFWEEIKNNVLIFQTDSILLRDGIDEFLEWEYIGAPWVKPKEGKLVGNGGLSFRKTQKMIDIINKNVYSDFINEDIYFCKFLEDLPPLSVAKRFSVEDIYYSNPLGIHQPKIDPQKLKELLDKSLERIKL
jgi:hypothetical protein